MKFSPHTTRSQFNQNLFTEARLVFFADDKKDQKLTPADVEKERAAKAVTEKSSDEVLSKLDNMALPESVKTLAKERFEHGGIQEKGAVMQLTSHTITPDMFRDILKCLRGEYGNDKTKTFFKTLAEQKSLGLISSSAFGLAFMGIENGDPNLKIKGDITLAELIIRLEKGIITGAQFDLAIEKSKAKIKASVRRASEDTPQRVQHSLQEQLAIANLSDRMPTVDSVLNARVGSTEDNEKLRGLRVRYEETTMNLIAADDRLSDYCERIARDANVKPEKQFEFKKKLAAVVMGSFGEPIAKNEIVKMNTEGFYRLEKEFGVNLKEHESSFVLQVNFIKEARARLAEVEDEIGTLFEPGNTASLDKYFLREKLKIEEKWLGIELKEGTKIRHMNVRPNPDLPGGLEYFWDVSEILSVGFENPEYVESESDVQSLTSRMLGMPIVIVTGAGTFNIGTLRKWMDAALAHQHIETAKEAERITGLDEIGVKIQTGMELVYDRNTSRDTNGNVATEPHSVKIEKIDGDKIILSEPVAVLYKEETGNRPICQNGKMLPLQADLMQKEFAYGEFARWFIRKSVKKKMTLDEANKGAAIYQTATETPAWNITPGTVLSSDSPGSGDYLRVDSTSPSAVTCTETGGRKRVYAPEQFLETVRKRNLVQADPKDYAARATEQMPDNEYKNHMLAQAEQEQREKINKALEPKKEAAGDDEEGGGQDEGDPIHPLPPMSKLRKIWKNTIWLDGQELWTLLKSMYEYHIRRWQRDTKWNVGKVGEKLPIITAEMSRMREAAEQEEVDKFKGGLEHLGKFEVRNIMWHAKNRDQLKACILILVESGHMRWDDVRLWEIVNKFTEPDKRIPIPLMDDTSAKVKQDPDTGRWRTGQDLIEGAIDAMWGEGIFGKWFNQNNQAYKSGSDAYQLKGDQLENDPKGIGGLCKEMQKLLTVHKQGGWTNPQQFEGLYRFSIIKGKMAVEDKLYFLVQGVATGLLALDRIGWIDGDYLNHMPWLDYFTNKYDWKFGQEFPPGVKEGDKGGKPYSVADLQRIAAYLDKDGDANREYANAPGPRTKKLLWEHILGFRDSRIRIQKAVQQSERLDHDDTHFIIPLLTESKIEQMCVSGGTTREHFSQPGYVNAFPGFNQYIKMLGEYAMDAEALKEGITSFVKYDAILDDRYKKSEGSRYVRINKYVMSERSVVDDLPTTKHREQMQNLILEIGRAYGHDFSFIFRETEPLGKDPENDKIQNEIEYQISRFNRTLGDLIAADKGKKMIQAVQKAKLTGYKFLSGKEQEKAKAAALEKSGETPRK